MPNWKQETLLQEEMKTDWNYLPFSGSKQFQIMNFRSVLVLLILLALNTYSEQSI